MGFELSIREIYIVTKAGASSRISIDVCAVIDSENLGSGGKYIYIYIYITKNFV